MTFKEIALALYNKGYTMADAATERMMDLVQDETGIYPDPDEAAPLWVILACGLSPCMIAE